MQTYEQAFTDSEVLSRQWVQMRSENTSPEFAVACSVDAIYSLGTEHPVDGPGEQSKPKRIFGFMSSRSKWLNFLEQAYGVTSRESAIEVVRALLENAGDPVYDLFRPGLEQLVAAPVEQRPAAYQQLRETAAQISTEAGIEELVGEFDAWAHILLDPRSVEALPSQLPRNLVGWDTTRAAWVLRLAYRSGLINDQDLGQLLPNCLAVTREHCANWREHAEGFLYGRAKWSETIDESSIEFRDKAIFCLESQEMPWARFPLHPSAHS
ncbi:hypothetical protein GCM10009631_14070 [Corynebacterium glaucum]|uniref:DUF1266 domain-containing protein n=1 Tax=Corynebacterium glaucum TaxID=187491 RepID=UPI0025B3401D|nr:DUF1266 domain-containing protein [Corynebacterium glaucum]